MKAVILSAGLGTRLKPMTDTIPKPLIDVGGKPVIQHLIDKLHKVGIYEIIVNVHHLPEKMLQLKDVLLSYEPELLGEQGTIMNLRHWLNDEPFFVLNGDTLSEVNYWEMLDLEDQMNLPIRHMQGIVYAGTTLFPRKWFLHTDLMFFLYNPNVFWIDMGTPEGLAIARQRYG